MAPNEVHPTRQDLDWLEPIEAYQRLRKREPMLLDGMGAHPDARFAYLALSGRLDVEFDGENWSIQHDDGTREVRTGDATAVLRALLSEWKFDHGQPGFTGGFVGYFGYEFTSALEPSLPRRATQLPQVRLRLCRDVVIFDRQTKQAHIVCNDLPGESGAPERLQSIAAELAAHSAMPELAAAPGSWNPSLDEAAFVDAVATVREHVRTGDLFQANIATRFESSWEADPVAVFAGIQRNNPSPYMALLEWPDLAIISNSPEQLFAVDGGRISTRPIAGTRPRSAATAEDAGFEAELLQDSKEQAEHMMLADLLRNDIARVSKPGTVRVSEFASVERYQRVMHLVSCVEGTVRNGTDFVDWLAALFPGGTITGAPKHRACLRIHEAEGVERGPYTGSAGFLSWDQSTTQWNIMIRTMVMSGGKASVHAGSGIVAASDPQSEWQEAGHKARALLDMAAGSTEPMDRVGDVTQHGQWNPPTSSESIDARVLLVDNFDSFVHNLADYCAALGAAVAVVRNDADVDAAMAEFKPTHVILSPGPGWPAEAGATPALARDLVGRLPVLGVCLGHQALAEAAGGVVDIAGAAVHGQTDTIHNSPGRLQDGLPETLTATRYHSLIVRNDTLPEDWVVTARLADGTIMAMEHAIHPAFGLQYHPESIGTPLGLDILIRFLRTQ